jgi:mersacidin/lichenicidin family type 2 lantibiotic
MSSNVDIVRAWKDEAYRASLSEDERKLLPENPAGMVELSDQELESIAGGKTDTYNTYSTTDTACCTTEIT